MNKVACFEELRIWQDARVMVQQVYSDMRVVSDYGFRDQLQRAGGFHYE